MDTVRIGILGAARIAPAAVVKPARKVGELGTLQRIETALCFPLPKFSDIRYQYDLAGGALMDVGTYTVHMARVFGREEPEVVSATAKLRTPNVDRAMRAELKFPSGHTGRITRAM